MLQRRYGTPSAPAYNSVLNYYAERNDAEGASQILDMMRQDGVEPDFATKLVLLKGLVAREEWAQAYEVCMP